MIYRQILSYNTNDIHNACETLGFSTDWELFVTELGTYTKQDKLTLLKELKGANQ